jgi:hypothetical protein
LTNGRDVGKKDDPDVFDIRTVAIVPAGEAAIYVGLMRSSKGHDPEKLTRNFAIEL